MLNILYLWLKLIPLSRISQIYPFVIISKCVFRKYQHWSCIYLVRENNEWNIDFIKNSRLGIQQTYSNEFSIGQSTTALLLFWDKLKQSLSNVSPNMCCSRSILSCFQDLEYADCILCRKISLLFQMGVLDMTLNCVWWWGSSFKYLESVDYPFIVITPRFTLLEW